MVTFTPSIEIRFLPPLKGGIEGDLIIDSHLSEFIKPGGSMRPRFFLTLLSLLLAGVVPLGAAQRLLPVPEFSRKDTVPATGVEVVVSVSPFLIGRTEVTQREFSEIMGFNPSFHQGENLPVDNVSWWEAVRYCNLLSVKEGL